MCLCASAACAAVIKKVHFNDLPNQWQFVLDADAPVSYKTFNLKKPSRVVIDFKNVRWRSSLPSKLWQGSGIKRVRLGEPQPGVYRLVLDLNSDYATRVSAMASSFSKPDRLVVNVLKYRHQETDFKRDQALADLRSRIAGSLEQEVKQLVHPKKKAPVVVKKKPSRRAVMVARNKPTSVVAEINPKKLRQIIVVIDPGHGGKDPGATGKRGSHEKNVVLAISKQLKKIIDKQPGFRAVLTRKGDYYLSLRKRLEIARANKADMFIAIHADAYKNTRSHGASVFALSQRGATSEAARWLAQRENASELMGGVDLADKGHLLRSVLLDLSQAATISASLKVGKRLLDSLKSVTVLHHSRVEQAAFVVLKSPDIPSLLVETGFISNWREEKNLNSRYYQRKLSAALLKGIVRYFDQYPPRGSWLAYQKRHNRQYVVHSGDSLSVIAQKFSVSVASLKHKNQLSHSRLRVGQVLKIPVRSV